ncbi:MAG: TatD family hydrolase [Ignisphaera sp.]
MIGQEELSIPFVDSHIHLHEYDKDVEDLCKDSYVFLAVSDDMGSSVKTIEVARRCQNVVPAIGYHPWNIKNFANVDMEFFEDIAKKNNVRFFGEIGLDKRFVFNTFDIQYQLFIRFVDIAQRNNMGLSIHAPDAWREALEVVKKSNIKVAIFHWYTGPIELLKEIVDNGYYIGINVAAKIQKKHLDIIRNVPLENIVTESDGPYRYRGLLLGPNMIPELISIIASIKNIDAEIVKEVIWKNFRRILREVGIPI